MIGEGSMASVYFARDLSNNTVVALKVIHEQLTKDGRFLARFQREAQIMGKLNTQYVVKVFDYGEEEGLNYIVMDYVEGETLAKRLEKLGEMEIKDALVPLNHIN